MRVGRQACDDSFPTANSPVARGCRRSTRWALLRRSSQAATKDILVGSGTALLRCRKHSYILSFHGRALIERNGSGSSRFEERESPLRVVCHEHRRSTR
jgi:hypothetical protein